MTTAHPTPTTTGRLRRRIVSALLALTVFGGTIVGTARPAQTATLIWGCFRTVDGSTLAAGTPVYLLIEIGGLWYNTSVNFPMDRYGCAWVPTNLYSSFSQRLYVNTGGALGTFTGGGTFYGWTRPVAPGTGFADLGTATLYYSCAGRVNTCGY